MRSKMTSITQQIWKEIDEDVIVRSALAKGIISLKGLAIYLMKHKGVEATPDAVISAIRRYREEQPLEKTFENARHMLAKSDDIRITSNIVRIWFEKTKQIQDILPKAFSLIDYDKGEIFLIIQGEQAIKLLINEKNKKKILALFPKQSIFQVDDHLAEINIQLSKDGLMTPGIVAVLTTELMVHEINIMEAMSCVPEMLFFVQQKDVVKSYEILFNLCKPAE